MRIPSNLQKDQRQLHTGGSRPTHWWPALAPLAMHGGSACWAKTWIRCTRVGLEAHASAGALAEVAEVALALESALGSASQAM
jgi:hypothetical protein